MGMMDMFKKSKPLTPARRPTLTNAQLFDASVLNDTFNTLQTAVRETSSLANSISAQLENKLEVTQQQLVTILSSTHDAIIITSDELIVQEWNKSAERMFGIEKKDVMGHHISAVCEMMSSNTQICNSKHGGNKQLARQFQRAATVHGTSTTNIDTIACHARSGSKIFIELSISTFNADQTKTGILAILRDVTAQRQQAAIRDRERMMTSAILNSIVDIVVVRDSTGRWILANQAAHAFYRFVSEKDYVGHTDEALSRNYPAIAAELGARTISFSEVVTTGRTLREERVVQDSHGTRQFYDVIHTPVKSPHVHQLAGTEPGIKQTHTRDIIITTARNVTALKEKREHILAAHKALNASSDVVVICDRNSTIMFVNRAFMVHYKYPDMADVVGKPLSMLELTNAPPHIHKSLCSAITGGQPWEGMMVTRDSRGESITAETKILPIVDETLNPSYYICTQRCIT